MLTRLDKGRDVFEGVRWNTIATVSTAAHSSLPAQPVSLYITFAGFARVTFGFNSRIGGSSTRDARVVLFLVLFGELGAQRRTPCTVDMCPTLLAAVAGKVGHMSSGKA